MKKSTVVVVKQVKKFSIDEKKIAAAAIQAYNQGAQEQLPKAINRYSKVCSLVGKAATERKVATTMVGSAILK